jgi:hypothetical protein
MFRRLALNTPIPNSAITLLSLHPVELTGLLEQGWNVRNHNGALSPGHPDHRSDVPGIGITVLPSPVLAPPVLAGAVPAPSDPFTTVLSSAIRIGIRWDHLIYAYMIENTRIYEIMGRVVYEFLHGEKLGAPTSPATQLWLRNTEELFYRDPSPFSITTVTSQLRSDLRASRRNAYQRMFGMDLNHGRDDNQPYSYVKAEASNNEFVATFEEFLREVWVGIVHVGSTSAPNPTDDAKIADLAKKLHDMLITRRQGGNLSREEFVFVAMMSWFHLTVDSSLPIIEDLRAQAASAEQRLFKIAQRVGLPAHGLSQHFFDIADATSTLLLGIETNLLSTAGAVPSLYNPAVAPPGGVNVVPDIMKTVINGWSMITGRNLKVPKVALT